MLLLSTLVVSSCDKKDKETGDEEEKIIPCMPQQLTGNVIALYSFSGGSLNDVSGRGTNLQNPTSAHSVTDRSGNANCAYRFGGNDFLTGLNTSFLNSLTGFTLSLWYRPIDSTRAGGDYEVLISRDSSARPGDRHGQWSVALYDCRKVVFSRHNTTWDKHITPWGSNTCIDEIKLRTGSWHHVAATWNSSDNLISLYRDGVLQDTSSTTIPGMTVLDKGALFIGRYYNGDIDDVIIFNRALTVSEVQQLSQLGTCCSK